MGKRKVNRKNNKAKGKLLFAMVPILTFGNNFSTTLNELDIYNRMNIEFKENNTIEYASDFDGMDFIDNVSVGKVVTITHIDTTKLGEHKVLYIIKQDNVEKEIYTTIEVVDTKGPEINIEKDNISIYTGEDYDITSNILSVKDELDGELEYKKEDIKETDKGYYTIESDFNKDVSSDYTVNIIAVDSYRS